DSEEAVVDISHGVDRRLYEDAIRRATGGERASRISAIRDRSIEAKAPRRAEEREMSTSETDASERIAHSRLARRPSEVPSPKKQISSEAPIPLHPVPVKSPSETVRLDPDVEARLRDLDELIAALDARQKGQRSESRRGHADRVISALQGRDPEGRDRRTGT